MSVSPLPTLRWGILGTGWVSSMFSRDMLLDRPGAKARHEVVAVGTSSLEKGKKFVEELMKTSPSSTTATPPRVYDNYKHVYDDPNVDIVFVGTPHSVHKRNALDAIAAGKHVLCEKPMCVNAKEAVEMIEAARSKGVFLMEGVWTRFFPLVRELQKHLNDLDTIGTVQRVFVDYGMNMPLSGQPEGSRMKDPKLGAGSILDIGVYDIMWVSLALGRGRLGKDHPTTRVACVDMDLVDGVDETATVVLKYDYHSEPQPSTAIITTTLRYKTGHDFCTIQGSKGSIIVSGLAASAPTEFRIRPSYIIGEMVAQHHNKLEVADPTKTYKFDRPGMGFHYEADSIAIDIAQGRLESTIMPLDETIRTMKLMDEIRAKGGVVYQQDM